MNTRFEFLSIRYVDQGGHISSSVNDIRCETFEPLIQKETVPVISHPSVADYYHAEKVAVANDIMKSDSDASKVVL